MQSAQGRLLPRACPGRHSLGLYGRETTSHTRGQRAGAHAAEPRAGSWAEGPGPGPGAGDGGLARPWGTWQKVSVGAWAWRGVAANGRLHTLARDRGEDPRTPFGGLPSPPPPAVQGASALGHDVHFSIHHPSPPQSELLGGSLGEEGTEEHGSWEGLSPGFCPPWRPLQA